MANYHTSINLIVMARAQLDPFFFFSFLLPPLFLSHLACAQNLPFQISLMGLFCHFFFFFFSSSLPLLFLSTFFSQIRSFCLSFGSHLYIYLLLLTPTSLVCSLNKRKEKKRRNLRKMRKKLRKGEEEIFT